MSLSAPALTLLMLDYDGTLTPIIPNYELAYIAPSHVAVLQALTKNPDVQLAIVSGRSVEQLLVFLQALEGFPVYMVGLHGGQIYDLKSGCFLLSPNPKYLEAIAALAHAVAQDPIFTQPGVQIENKGFSLGIHFRQANEEDGQQAIAALKRLFDVMKLEGDFLMKPGKQLLEVVPLSFNKGTGVEQLIQIVSEQSQRPLKQIFIGDDVTDFDAFRVVNAHDGDSYYVGPTLPSDSPPVKGRLDSVAAVYQFLDGFL
jgi:trehalose 6-phosphate phosphatase